MAPSFKSPAAKATSAARSSGSEGSAHPPAAAVFNPELALERCCGKPGLLQEMIACFFCEMESLFPQMRSALQRGIWPKSAAWGTG